MIIFLAGEDGEALYSQQKQERLGADCGSDHELLIVKFRLKLKKAEKNTRPFMYDEIISLMIMKIKSLMIIQWK